MTRRSRFALLVTFVLTVSSWLAGPSALAADPTIAECLAANADAANLSNEHKPVEAQRALLSCAASSCPSEIQQDCAARVAEVTAAIPTIVFELQDAAGNDLSSVAITADGAPAGNAAAGTAIALDPGEHTFTFVAPGQAAVEKRFVLVEGAKNRRERIRIGEQTAAPPVPTSPASQAPAVKAPPAPAQASPVPDGGAQGAPSSYPRKVWGWATLGVGAAVAVGGAVVALVAQGQLPSARSTLASVNAEWARGSGNACDPSTDVADQPGCISSLDNATNHVNNLDTLRLAGWISAGVGGGLAVTGIVLALTAKSGPADDPRSSGKSDTGVELVPLVGPKAASIGLRFSF
jgi:hypothetical protein